MATGINSIGMGKLKVELLDSTEEMNKLLERLDLCRSSIDSNMSGPGKKEILQKLNSIIEYFPRVNGNINHYISVLSKIEEFYERQDSGTASDIIKNITKLEN